MDLTKEQRINLKKAIEEIEVYRRKAEDAQKNFIERQNRLKTCCGGGPGGTSDLIQYAKMIYGESCLKLNVDEEN